MAMKVAEELGVTGMDVLENALMWEEIDPDGKVLLCEGAADVLDSIRRVMQEAAVVNNEAMMQWVFGEHERFHVLLLELRKHFSASVLDAFDRYAAALDDSVCHS